MCTSLINSSNIDIKMLLINLDSISIILSFFCLRLNGINFWSGVNVTKISVILQA